MRAIRISEWGGPEVLELVEDAPVPEPDEQHVLVRVTSAGINFADTHARENSYLARYELPLTPGAEIAGVVERDGSGFSAGQRVVSLVGTGGYAEYVGRAGGDDVPDPRRRERRDRARAAAPGPDRVAPVPHVGAARAGRERRRARRGRRRRLARRAARQAARRGPRDRDRARPRRSARWRSSWAPTPRSTSRARTSTDALVEANLGERVDVVLEMAGGRVFDASLDALAPFGRLVTYGIASREPNTVSYRRADAQEPRGRRLLADALPAAPGRDGRRAAAGAVRAHRRRRAARRRGRDLPALGGPPRPRGPAGAPDLRQARSLDPEHPAPS